MKSIVSELHKDSYDSKMALQKLSIEHAASTETIESMTQEAVLRENEANDSKVKLL